MPVVAGKETTILKELTYHEKTARNRLLLLDKAFAGSTGWDLNGRRWSSNRLWAGGGNWFGGVSFRGCAGDKVGAAILKGEPLPGCITSWGIKTRSDLRLLGARTKRNRKGKHKKKMVGKRWHAFTVSFFCALIKVYFRFCCLFCFSTFIPISIHFLSHSFVAVFCFLLSVRAARLCPG